MICSLAWYAFSAPVEVSLRHEDIADPFFADADVILPLGVGGVRLAPAARRWRGRHDRTSKRRQDRPARLGRRRLCREPPRVRADSPHCWDFRPSRIVKICVACRAAASAPVVSPTASSVSTVSRRDSPSLRLRSGVTWPELMSSSCSPRARSRMSLTRVAGIPIEFLNLCARSKTRLFAVFVAAAERLLRAVSLRDGFPFLPISQHAGCRRRDGEDEEGGGRAPGQRERAALLAHFLREQILLRYIVNGGGEIGGKLGELGVALVGRVVGALAVGAQIHPFRLARKTPRQHLWQRHGLAPDEIAGGFVPDWPARGQPDQQRVDRVAFEPGSHLLVDPFGGGGFRRSEQDEMARLPERLLDHRPQMRCSGEAGVVAEQSQRAPPVPGIAGFWIADCSAAAIGLSLAWLYEMNAS